MAGLRSTAIYSRSTSNRDNEIAWWARTAPARRSAAEAVPVRDRGGPAAVGPPSLVKMLDTCMATVLGLMNSASAIWRSVRPSAISASTSRSREVRPYSSVPLARRPGSPPGPAAAWSGGSPGGASSIRARRASAWISATSRAALCVLASVQAWARAARAAPRGARAAGAPQPCFLRSTPTARGSRGQLRHAPATLAHRAKFSLADHQPGTARPRPVSRPAASASMSTMSGTGWQKQNKSSRPSPARGWPRTRHQSIGRGPASAAAR